jgi:quinol monooxygenase YgiN
MSTMAVLESGTNPAKLESFKPFLEKNLPNVRGFDGCLGVSVLHNPETNGFLIYEEWKSEAHHKAYIDAIRQSGVLDQLSAYLTRAPSIKYFTRLPI